jgi:hypothetical protein
MLHELYELFEKKTEIVLNKVMQDVPSKSEDDLQAKVKDTYQAPLLGVIPCFCDILRAQGDVIYAQDKPDHPLVRILDEMVATIEKST